METSAPLQAQQEALLGPYAKSLGCELVWHDTIDEIKPDASLFTSLVAHEFFDALPFKVVQVSLYMIIPCALVLLKPNTQKTEKGWSEVLIASTDYLQSGSSTSEPRPLDVTTPGFGGSAAPSSTNVPSNGDRFRPVLSPSTSSDATLLGSLSSRYASLPVGSRVEVSPESARIAGLVGKLLRPEVEEGHIDAGTALVVDYGADHCTGDSFRVRCFPLLISFPLPSLTSLLLQTGLQIPPTSLTVRSTGTIGPHH